MLKEFLIACVLSSTALASEDKQEMMPDITDEPKDDPLEIQPNTNATKPSDPFYTIDLNDYMLRRLERINKRRQKIEESKKKAKHRVCCLI